MDPHNQGRYRGQRKERAEDPVRYPTFKVGRGQRKEKRLRIQSGPPSSRLICSRGQRKEKRLRI